MLRFDKIFVSDAFREMLEMGSNNILFRNTQGRESQLQESQHKDGLFSINYLDIARDNPKRISYLPIARKDRVGSVDETYNPKMRMMAKPGKIFRAIFPEATDSQIEQAANMWYAVVGLENSDQEFEIVSGDDIKHWYHEDQYSDTNTASLAASCMRYSSCSKFLNIYSENPEVCKMLILTVKGELIGRALIWKVGDRTIMDRVYGQDSIIATFTAHARKNGWIYKERQSFDHRTTWMSPENDYSEAVTEIMTIEGVKGNFNHYPYFDTFPYMSEDMKSLSNQPIGGFVMQSTDGDRDKDYLVQTHSGNWQHIDTVCEILGVVYPKDECRFLPASDVWVMREDAVYCRPTGNYIHKDESVRIRGGDHATRGHQDVVKIGNILYLKSDDMVTRGSDGVWKLRRTSRGGYSGTSLFETDWMTRSEVFQWVSNRSEEFEISLSEIFPDND